MGDRITAVQRPLEAFIGVRIPVPQPDGLENKIAPGGFIDFAWVSAKEVLKYKCIKGIKEEIKETIELFSEEANGF